MEIYSLLNIYDKLPLEIIFEIVKYLEYDDIKQLRLVSRRSEIISNDVFIKRTRLNLSKLMDEFQSLSDCNLSFEINKFSHVKLNEFKFEYYPENASKSFKLFCDGIVDLLVIRRNQTQKLFCNWIKSLSNLKRFKWVWYYGRETEKYEMDNIISILFDRVDAIKFEFPCLISLDVIEKIAIGRISTITELDLYLYDVFTDDNKNQHIRDSALILLLKKLSKSLKKFSIKLRLRKETNLLLGLIETELDLNSLTIEFYDTIDLYDFEKFAVNMKNLEYLDIYNEKLCDKSVKTICNVIKTLKVLRIYGKDITNECINLFGNLEMLESLSLTNINGSPTKNTGMTQRLVKTSNENLKYIKLYGYWDDVSVMAIVTNFKNLESLELLTQLNVSPKSVLLIYDRLQKLRKLHIDIGSSRQVSVFNSVDSTIDKLYHLEDLVLKGIEIDVDKISRLKNLKYLTIIPLPQPTQSSFHQIINNCRRLKKIVLLTYYDCCFNMDEINRICCENKIKFMGGMRPIE